MTDSEVWKQKLVGSRLVPEFHRSDPEAQGTYMDAKPFHLKCTNTNLKSHRRLLFPAMALLGEEYASSDEEPPTTAPTVVAAPDVSLDVWSHSAKNRRRA